jgi:hypothetical protein
MHDNGQVYEAWRHWRAIVIIRGRVRWSGALFTRVAESKEVILQCRGTFGTLTEQIPGDIPLDLGIAGEDTMEAKSEHFAKAGALVWGLGMDPPILNPGSPMSNSEMDV